MSLETEKRDLAAEVRGAARRQARGWSGAGPLLAGGAITAVLMIAFITLDYRFNQDPHRIVKVALGLLAMGAVFSQPHFGLLLLPVASPFLLWVPPLPIPGLNALNVMLLGIFGSFALGQVMARKPFVRSGRLGPCIALLLGLCALSILRGALFPTGFPYSPPVAILLLVRAAATFVGYFIVLSMARGEKDRRYVTWAVLTGLLLESIVVAKLGRNGSGQRAVGSIGQANELGAYLSMFVVLALALAMGARSWFARLCATVIFALGSFAVLLSLSRGSLLALVGGAAFVMWRSSRIGFAILLVVLVASPFWLPDYVIDRITQSTSRSETDDGVSVDQSAQIRLVTWRAILGVIATHPIDGVGFNGLGAVLPDMGEALGLADVRDSAHNTYLRMVGEVGIFGLFAFLFVLWKVFRLGTEAARRASLRFDRAIGIGLSGATITLAISCAFGDRFWSPVVVGGLWILAGAVEDSFHHPPVERPA